MSVRAGSRLLFLRLWDDKDEEEEEQDQDEEGDRGSETEELQDGEDGVTAALGKTGLRHGPCLLNPPCGLCCELSQSLQSVCVTLC